MTTYFKPKATFPMVPEGGLFCNHSSRKYPLGTKVYDVNGNAYRYVYAATEAIAQGELVTHVAIAAWDSTTVVDGTAAAGDSLIHVDTNTSVWTGNQYKGYYLRQAEASGKGSLQLIKSHPAISASSECDVQIEGSVSEAFADGATLYIFHPYAVELTDAATETIVGVGIGDISSGYYGFVQVGGVHPGVLCDGDNGADVVANEIIVPYSTDPGQGQGYATADEAGDMEVANSPIVALDGSTQDAGYVPARFVREL